LSRQRSRVPGRQKDQRTCHRLRNRQRTPADQLYPRPQPSLRLATFNLKTGSWVRGTLLSFSLGADGKFFLAGSGGKAFEIEGRDTAHDGMADFHHAPQVDEGLVIDLTSS
jgi:hypothetical protein